ncbi:MAG: hypothetical protein ACTSU5_19680 [Promethearchaeota archaeon]
MDLTDYDIEFLKYVKQSPMGRSMGDIVAFFIDPKEARDKLDQYTGAGLVKKTDILTYILTPEGKKAIS